MKIYPSHDVLRENRRNLHAFFSPKTVAMIGATDREGSVGRTLAQNLLNPDFKGKVFFVNPNRDELLGQPCYANLQALPVIPDLVVIVVKAQYIPDVMEEMAAKGCKSTVIISAGFKEVGEKGVEREKQILSIAKKHQIRIIGPNCLGIMRPKWGLNATFAASMAKAGNIAFISQSGAICTSILDWSRKHNLGFSTFISIGSMADVAWGDLLHHLGNDGQTKAIVLYMESIGDARGFMSAAREVALSKPIIIIKAGSTEAAAKAAASHTGSLAGSFDVMRMAFRRVGVMRVQTISELFNMADVLSKQPRPKGNRLAIVTNAGGPGVLTTDALIQAGGEVAALSLETITALSCFLKPHWSHGNPVDILGDAQPETFQKTLEVVTKDPNVDGLLVILSPQGMTDPTKVAEALVPYAKWGKPILASWMGEVEVAEGRRILNEAGIPEFEYPDEAAKHFVMMWRYDRRISSLYQTPRFAIDTDEIGREKANVRHMIESVLKSNRTLLTEAESKQILAAYGIPTIPTFVAHTEEEAVARAKVIGFPVVLKLQSLTISHKSDVGGVKLRLANEEAVRDAFRDIQSAVAAEDFNGCAVQPMSQLDGIELILGSSTDPQFGPVLLFGTGGTLVEVFKDRALGLPPLNTNLARMMMENTKIYEALKGVRGKRAVDMTELEELMVRFSQLVTEQRRIKEIDINPLIASDKGLLALDARVVLHEAEIPDHALPQPAIRPYPIQYVHTWAMHDGEMVTIRPIMAEDEPLVADFHRHVSEHSVYMRYFSALNLSQRVRHERLIRVAHVDYGREMAIVVERNQDETPELLAIGRLSIVGDTGDAEFSMLIRDDQQRQGIGTKLLTELCAIAKAEGMRRVIAEILPENKGMQAVCKKVGFELQYDSDAGVVHAAIVV